MQKLLFFSRRLILPKMLLAMVAIFGCVNCLYPQSLAFTRLSVEDGLSQGAVLSIAQDSSGFIWIGTSTGLNQYDSRTIATYKNNPADSNTISSNYITATITDSQGQLWVGTDNGLNLYNPQNNTFKRLESNAANQLSLSDNNIYCLLEDKDKHIWVGTHNGLNRLANRKSNTFTTLLAGYEIYALMQDHAGFLWVGTSSGLLKISPTSLQIIQTYTHTDGLASSISQNFVTTLLQDAQHRIWAGTESGGLNLLDTDSGGFTHFVHSNTQAASIVNDNIRKLTLDKNGLIWVGTQEGLALLDPISQKFTTYRHDTDTRNSLSQNSIHSIFKDRDGTMWVGTFFGGINIAYTNAFTLYQNNKSENSLSNNVVSSLVEDASHNLWIGTEGGGLNYFNRRTGSFAHYVSKVGDVHSLPSNLVKVVYKDKKGNIWVGTHRGGLCRFNPATQQFTRHQNVMQSNGNNVSGAEIVAIQEDSHGRIWVGNQQGLTYLEEKNGQFSQRTQPAPFELPTKNVHCLYESPGGDLWIGTSAGLFLFKDKTQQLVSFAGSGSGGNALRQASINCVKQDSKGRLWIGTAFNGLGLFEGASQSLQFYTQKNGLPSNNILGILEDAAGNLWLSAENGLCRFNPQNKTIYTYSSTDGLAGNQFNYNAFFKDSNGEFFFGGYNGITAFFPDKIATNHTRAPMVFTGLRLFNTPVGIHTPDGLLSQNISHSKSIVFKYHQNAFTIHFALLNFIKSSKNKYQYKLEGYDKYWVDASNASASYTNVPPGNYTFWAKGANNDGVWSEPVAIGIKVRPPFWLTWWAYCLYVLLAAAMVFFITRFFFLRALIKKEEDLHQIKLNFFTNVSHEIRTHLTLIMAPIQKLMNAKSQERFEEQKKHILNVSTNAERLLRLVNELMDFRKAESDNLPIQLAQHNIVAFLEDIFSTFKELALSKSIQTTFVSDQENIPVFFDANQMEKVFFNLLSNAFKFTPEGGNIGLAVEQKDGQVQITVTDNGLGIAPEYIDKLFNNFFQVADHGLQNTGYGIGLALAKNIVGLHKGTIAVASQPSVDGSNSGTSFTVTLLQGSQHFGAANIPAHTAPASLPADTNLEHTKLQAATNYPNGDAAGSFTILISEDNAGLRQLMEDTFTDGYTLILTENGLQGWEKCIEEIPDLVISDVMMPEMDGFTLCSKLKTDERTSHIPVILLTARNSQIDQVSGLETGADIYLTKPFNEKILTLHVRNLLASREKMRRRYSQQITAPSAPVATAHTAALPATPPEEKVYLNPVDKEFLDKLHSVVDEYMDHPEFGVEMICKKVGMSRSVLYKKLDAVTGLSVNDLVKSLRLKKASALLLEKRYTIAEISYAVGYNDIKYFRQEFKKLYGVGPADFATVGNADETQ